MHSNFRTVFFFFPPRQRVVSTLAVTRHPRKICSSSFRINNLFSFSTPNFVPIFARPRKKQQITGFPSMSTPPPESAAESLAGDAAEVPESETLAPVDGGDPIDVETLSSFDGGEGGDRRVRYRSPGAEENAVFTATDMVWSKVKSHPWWPGQIFDPKHASEMASKCQKKDHVLVAYFGDKTFAWCEASQLKPFRSSFSQLEKQSRMNSFTNAVEAAIEEASRQVELGMSCHCAKNEALADLKDRKVENAGIKEGTCCCVDDKGLVVNLFEPERLLEYVEALAQCPYGEVDRLELATAKAQLKAFYRWEGRAGLSGFVLDEELLENDADAVDAVSGKKPRCRSKKLKDVSEDVDVLNDDLTVVSVRKSSRGRPIKTVVSVRKSPRGRPIKLRDVSKDADVANDDLTVVSGRKSSRGRSKKLKDVPEIADVANDDLTVVSGKKNSRGRAKKLKDLSEDADVIEDDSAGVLGKNSRGRSRKLKYDSEDAVGDDLVVVSEKTSSRGRPKRLINVSEAANDVVDDSAAVSGKRKSRGRPKKLKDVSKDEDVVEDDAAIVSGRKSSRGRPKKLKDVSKDEDVEDDSAVVSGKKSSRGRPKKLKDVSKDEDVVEDDSAVGSEKKSSRGRSKKFKDVSTDTDVVDDEEAVVSKKKSSRGRIKKLKDVSKEADIVEDDSAVVSGKDNSRGRPKKFNDGSKDVKSVNDESVVISGMKRSRGRPRKVQGASEDDGNQKIDAENGKRGDSRGKYTSSKPEDDDSDKGKEGRSRKKRVDYLEMVSPSSARNRSAKVGGHIRKVASQMQRSSTIFKCDSGELQTTDEMLSQLRLVAAEPMKYHSLLSTISFFTDFRATTSTDTLEEQSVGGKRGRKKEVVDSDQPSLGMPMTDSYWNDLLLQSSPEREPVSQGRKRKKGSKGKNQKKKTKSATMLGNEQGLLINTLSPSPEQQEPNSEVVDKMEETGEEPQSDSLETPTALILCFTESAALPSEADLIQIFSRYGPLEEAETEILRDTNRAKVVYKNRSNAELAFSNAGNGSVFGQALVSFRLRYLQPSPKTSPRNPAQVNRDALASEVGVAELPAEVDAPVASENT